jgi:molybdopterin-biosynthesis enzyme MoeA-like protein
VNVGDKVAQGAITDKNAGWYSMHLKKYDKLRA